MTGRMQSMHDPWSLHACACMPCETVVIMAKRVISSCDVCAPNLASCIHLRGTHVHGCTCVPKPTHSTAVELECFVAWLKTLSNTDSLEIAAINQWHADGNRESRGRIPSRTSVWACMDCLPITIALQNSKQHEPIASGRITHA